MSLPDTSSAEQRRNPRRAAILDAAELLLKRDEDGDGLPPLSFADVADPGEKLGAWCETAIRTAPGTDDLWREQLARIHLDEAARRRITLFQERASVRVDAFVNELDGIPDSRRGLLASTIREAVGSAVRLSALHPDDTERIAGWFAASLEAIVGNVRAENGDTAA